MMSGRQTTCEADQTVADRERLRNGRVLVVGAGGLGCPAALALALAGVGTIGLIDADRVDLSNLHRQILHTDADIGIAKVESARVKLAALHPAVTIRAIEERLTANTLPALFRQFDFVIDGTDTAASKFLINDGAVLTGTPYSHAGILGFRGQTFTVIPHRSACYRCLFPTPPPADEVPTCQEAGVIGMVAGAIGAIQAAEAIKFLLRRGELLTNRLLTFDALTARWRSITLKSNPHCPLCSARPTIQSLAAEADAAWPELTVGGGLRVSSSCGDRR
ncbi:MAG: HesA/MoeB/ThiF family protein [Deltaproteobacteria bacterium]|nr:HesA/MoeB/ThiF family protein [Deltaproteobacteria bacterium]MBI3391448.1 HesA/MoeB/ThiF family protein [Deltaproteobacteria bacterium]